MASLEAGEITKDDFRRREIELEQEHADTLVGIKKDEQDRKLAIISAGLDQAAQAIQNLSSISDDIAEFQINRAVGNEERQDQIRRKAFKRSKALKIADATISGIQGSIGAFSQAMATLPPPAGAIVGTVSAALVAASTAANIAKISSTTFDGGGSVGASVPTAGGSISIDTSTPTTSFTGTAGNTGGSNSNTAGINQTPTIVRAFVTETDITNAQGNINNIEDFAGFGPG